MKDKPNILIFFPDQHRGDWMPYTKDGNCSGFILLKVTINLTFFSII